MSPVGKVAAISLDTTDPEILSKFYQELLGYDVVFESDEFIALKGAGGVGLAVQRVADHVAPTWPSASIPKQIHLELSVKNLEDAETQALALGASKPDAQPSPDNWRVLLDPAGHPFCITTMIPDDF